MSATREPVPEDYPVLLAQLKEAIGHARLKAALSVNRELTLLYWQIGRDILSRQSAGGWWLVVGGRKSSIGSLLTSVLPSRA